MTEAWDTMETEAELPYEEELFGILTDDGLYLDCTLVKPAGLPDEAYRGLRVWVPRYPLTKSTLIACARQEVLATAPAGKVGHLVFDLRGTGFSDGDPRDTNFNLDLQAIRLWATERFGPISVSLLGHPQGQGRARLLPIRPGVAMEIYLYTPASPTEKPPILYLATYANFSAQDDTVCAALAGAGYPVYGMDPLRYLLHASLPGRVLPSQLWADLNTLCSTLPAGPILLGQPVSAGLALLWASGVPSVRGVIAIGHTQMAFKPSHIFQNDNVHNFFLGRQVQQIAPRPVLFVLQENHPLGGDPEELAALYQTCGHPRKRITTPKLTLALLLELLDWVQAQPSP